LIWLALMGDNVDNIPGVPGVGPKTAAEMLKRFGSVDELLARLDEVKQPKLRASLQASVADVRRNLNLVRLQDTLPCDFSPERLMDQPVDAGTLAGLFRQWGFKSLLEDLERANALRQTMLI